MSNLILLDNTPFEREINHWKHKLRWGKPFKLFIVVSKLINLIVKHTFIFLTNKKTCYSLEQQVKFVLTGFV